MRNTFGSYAKAQPMATDRSEGEKPDAVEVQIDPELYERLVNTLDREHVNETFAEALEHYLVNDKKV